MWSSGRVLLLALALGSVRAQDVIIGFSQPTYDVAEGAGMVTVTVAVLNGTLDQDIEVTVSTMDGSATAGSDYTAITNMPLMFSTGSTTSQDVPVTIIDDGTLEASESFSLTLTLTTTNTNVTVDPASATVNIQDDGDVVTIGFNPATYSVTEGAGSVNVTVAVQGSLGRDVVVTLSTMNGTATAPGDYTAITDMQLTFSASMLSQTVTITIADGAVVEGPETFSVTLATSDTAVMLNPTTAAVNIQEDNDMVTIGFDSATYSATEGAGSVTVTVAVQGPLERAVVVTLSTMDGTATAPGDYTAIPNMLLTFSAAMMSQTVMITIADGAVVEGPETFSVNLNTSDNAVTLNPMTAAVNIQEDNDMVTIGFDSATYSVTEGASSVNVTVAVQGSLGRDVVVTLSTMDGTATAPGDYTAIPNMLLTFSAAMMSQTVMITIADGTVLEGTETFSVTLATSDTAVMLNPMTAAVNIQEDNDMVTIGFNPATYSVTEGAGSVDVTVAVQGSLERAVVVTLSTMDGTATASNDYTAITDMQLTFSASMLSQTVMITIADGAVVEGPETFSVNLTTSDPAVMLNLMTAAVNIQEDNDIVTIGFDSAAYSVTEGAGSVDVTVAVQGSLGRDVVVTLSTVDGTASAPIDYTAIASMQLTFSVSMLSQTVTITIADGSVLEGPETFSVTLETSDTAVMLNPMTAAVDIQEDNDTVDVGFETPPVYIVSESAGSVRVCAVLTGQRAMGRSVMVTFTTAGGSAVDPDDYIGLSVNRTFPVGMNVACVNITIQPDSVNEVTAESFTVTVTSGDSAVVLVQNVATVNIVDPPVITTQPVAQLNVFPGMNAMFSVVATGSDLTYQWQRAGVNLTDTTNYSGTTTASLTVLNVMEADEEMFRCIVTNAVDSITSMSAQLTVLDQPQITLQPSDQSEVVPGSTVMFMITATTAAGTLSYQWQRNGDDIPPASGVSGTNSTTLTITNVQEVNEGSYSCVVTNDAGNTTSTTAQLTVLDRPVITTQPQDRLNAIPDTAVTFSVTVTGLNLAYSWEQGDGSDLPSDSRYVPSNEILSIQNVMPSDVGSYRCVVTNDAGNVTSNAAELTLIGPPDITAPPQSVAVESGGNAEFTCTATGLGSLGFMWTTTASVSLPPPVDTSDPEGMNATSTLNLTGVDTSYRGEYICRVNNERGNDTSQATLSVIVIDDIMPNNVTAPLGSDVTFTCNASGSEDISYYWTRTTVGSNGRLVDVGFNDEFPGRVVGARTSMLTILNVSVVDVEEGYDYTCFVEVNSTDVGFRTAILRTQTVTIIEAPSSFNISEGDDLILQCVAQNNPNAPGDLQFFWYNDSIGLEDGGRVSIMTSGENASRVASSELTVMDVKDEDSGNYTCRVTNRDFVDAIEVDSEITVLFSPVLNFPEGQQTMDRVLRINVGETLPLMCTATAVPPATYVRILRNGVQLVETLGSDSRSLSVMNELRNLMLSDSDVFGCVASNSEGRTERSFTLVVQDRPGVVDNNTVVPTLVSLSSVRLTWTQPEENNANITSYNITYCPTANNGQCVAQVPTTISVTANGSSAVLTELTPVRRYRVYIRAVNLAGMGPESQPYFFDSADEDDAQLENLRAAFVSDTGVVLTWQLPEIASSEQNVIFSLSYTRRGSGDVMTTTVTTQGATVGGLDSGSPYDFSVAAMYNLLNSTATNISQDTQQVYNPPPNTMAPTVESDSITISWPAPGGVELVVNSTVEYTATNRAGQSSGRKRRQANTISGRIPVPGSATSATVMGDDLQPFYDYVFRVFSNFGNGLVAEVVDPFTATSAEAPPSMPQNLQFGIFHVSLTVRWTAPASPRGIIATYVACIGTQCQAVPAEQNEYTRDGLNPGTTYNVRVNASNGAGAGDVAATTSTTSFGVFPPNISEELPSPEQGIFDLTIRLPATYGPISHYKVVVVRTGNREINTRTEVPDNMLLPAAQSQTNYYAAASLLRVGETQAPFSVGDGQISTLNGMTFENVRLSADQYYVVFTRAYSSQIPTSFNDSQVSQAFRFMTTMVPTPVPAAAIIGPIAGIAVLLLIVFIILLIVAILTQKPRTKGRHRFDDGMDGKKKGHAVELRRTRLFSPVLNVACPDVFTSAGQPTTLLCEASGTPAPEVTWTCDGKPLDKERCIQLADSSLFIQDTDPQDEGNYLVVATNSAGTAEQMVRVTVIRPVPPEPDTMHMPIPVGDFTERIALLRLNDDEGLEDEYADVDLDWNFTSYASKLNINKNKNRYVNIIPYDHSRVPLALQDNTPGSDYINASFVDGYNRPNAYIATQGPIPSTFPDFWRMVWELDCPTIVMVTNLKEDDKVKCNQYWPSYGTTTYGSLQVTLKEVENLAEYSIRTFNISPLAGQSKVQMPVREVRQFHFMVWPDHGVPQFATALLSFRKRVIRYHPEKRGPMVVHCSAGVGRTGTFITIDVMLKQMEAENMIDIFNFVRHMRFRRNYMVQTSPQYIFLHDSLLEAIMCGDTSIPAPELRKKLLSLMEVDSETKNTRMETQFETLNSASPADEDFDTTIAELPDNMAKNRFKHHLPSSDLRVVLSTDSGQSDYICASFVDGYRQRIAFIVTQGPMTNTIGDFWRMVWEQKSAAIVMLTELEEGGQEMCVKYWPVEVGQPEVFGAYQVELSDDEREVGDYITRKFKLSPIDKPQESRIITQFHYFRWPRSSAPTNTRSMIDLIDQLQRVQRKSGNGPITVHCDDGLGRTGAFCTLYTVLERVKTEQVVDIFQAVKTIRIQRTGLLETLAQYEYVHKAVLEFLDTFSDYQNFK